ncbi:hypothetical protein [Metabacillus halosaccharovorans]|uniref:hypothetical protein n=1 Tax=Metabacillus halosaccharovorans TaxID=930124 RepID=UPI001C1FCD60|nr:hypothetical protein [Metabacillus halosaccharovorans]MBU7594490.1 hypothetical protein [Metabacillus halosaccharovorans]
MANQDSSSSSEEKYETTYQEGFPQEASSALSTFMQHVLSDSVDRKLVDEDGNLIFSDGNRSVEESSVIYYQFTEEQLKDYYKPLLQTEELNVSLNPLKQSNSLEKLRNPLENYEQYSLPSIAMKENNQLEIKTTENQRIIDLNNEMKQYGITGTTEFIMNIEAVNEENFVIVLADTAKGSRLRELYYLFIKRDLSDFTITQLKYEETQEIINSNVLKPFYDIFPGEGDYKSLFNNISILDVTTNKITEIKDNDLLSEDGNFVYLNGAAEELSDGEQRIQTIENYAKGNDIYEEQFDIDFDRISEKMDFETDKISIAKTNYFNEDYIVLHLLYRGKTIGEGGGTNVIVDLQNKQKPTAYLVDLGME